jgi:hypothetical protein
MWQALTIVLASGLAAVPELTVQQLAALEAISDDWPSFDTAPLYVLLANVSIWPDSQAALAAGAMIPDYAAIRANPGDYRGKRFAIEGTLESIIKYDQPPFSLAREGWEHVQQWHVRTEGGGVVVVFLTHAPDLRIERQEGGHLVPFARGAEVKAVGRFFKLWRKSSEGGSPAMYQIYVGKTAVVGDPPGGLAPSVMMRTLPVLLLVILVAGGFAVIRLAIRRPQRSIGYARGQRQDFDQEEDAPIEYRQDLPEDPADALDVLHSEKEEQRRHTVNPLADTPAPPSPDDDGASTPEQNDHNEPTGAEEDQR